MSLSFNWNTVLSSFDKRGTLLAQLKDMEDAFEKAGMTGCEVVEPTATSVKLKFTFEDGTSLTTDAIDIKGAKGDPGTDGVDGADGVSATVAVGTTTTLTPGSDATVTNSGTSMAAVLNFGIPKGEKGDTGAAGGIVDIDGYAGSVTTQGGLKISNSGVLSSQDFDLTTTGSAAISSAPGISIITAIGITLYYALNADKSIGKIYGSGYLTISGNGQTLIPTGIKVAAPSTQYNIDTGLNCICLDRSGTSSISGPNVRFYVDTSGDVWLNLYTWGASTQGSYLVQCPACLYFFKDFGDQLAKGALDMAQRMAALNPVEQEK